MDVKATIYDLLGYFVPGIVSIGLSLLIVFQLKPNGNITEIINSLFSSFSIYHAILLVIASYLLGFLYSGFSNIYFDNLFSFLKRKLNLENILDKDSLLSVNEKFKKQFETDLTESNFWLLICIVENEKPNIYSTALYYLSYYGMSRTLFFLFSSMSLLEFFFYS